MKYTHSTKTSKIGKTVFSSISSITENYNLPSYIWFSANSVSTLCLYVVAIIIYVKRPSLRIIKPKKAFPCIFEMK